MKIKKIVWLLLGLVGLGLGALGLFCRLCRF